MAAARHNLDLFVYFKSTVPPPGFLFLTNKYEGNDKCGSAEISFYTDSDPCITNELEDEELLGLKPDCHLKCEVKTNLVKKCGDSNSGNRLITNGVYFIFRMMATMALASCFILLDAQTIQMCAVEEKHGKKGAYGRQILYKTLAQAVISPLVGALMDYITAQQGQPNYVASFIIADIMFLMSFLCALKIDTDLELPINKDAMKGLRSILTNFEILLFLVMMFICGIMYGFVETFLFVFLKEDLHAPMYLLGLTITTGAVVSLPFLYYSDAIVKKVGRASRTSNDRTSTNNKVPYSPYSRKDKFLTCFHRRMFNSLRFLDGCVQLSGLGPPHVRGEVRGLLLHQLRLVRFPLRGP